jgi:hypothetical protein
MAKKNSKRRPWTSTDVREVKSAARNKTPAGKIVRSLKRSEGPHFACRKFCPQRANFV